MRALPFLFIIFFSFSLSKAALLNDTTDKSDQINDDFCELIDGDISKQNDQGVNCRFTVSTNLLQEKSHKEEGSLPANKNKKILSPGQKDRAIASDSLGISVDTIFGELDFAYLVLDIGVFIACPAEAILPVTFVLFDGYWVTGDWQSLKKDLSKK